MEVLAIPALAATFSMVTASGPPSRSNPRTASSIRRSTSACRGRPARAGGPAGGPVRDGLGMVPSLGIDTRFVAFFIVHTHERNAVMSSPLTELNWIVIIGVFAATVLAHALLIVAAARAKERWGRRRAGSEIAVHRREVLGQGCSRTSGGHAAGVAVESHGV